LGAILPAILSHGVPFEQRRAPAAAERPQCIDIQKRIGVIIVLHKIIPAFFRPTDLRGTVFLAFYEKASVSGTKKRMIRIRKNESFRSRKANGKSWRA
jgi:hypothetical protein